MFTKEIYLKIQFVYNNNNKKIAMNMIFLLNLSCLLLVTSGIFFFNSFNCITGTIKGILENIVIQKCHTLAHFKAFLYSYELANLRSVLSQSSHVVPL